MDILTLKFQSTHPQGVRLLTRLNQHLKRGFNPRTRRGCDKVAMDKVGESLEFQSTHPQGVRPSFHPRNRHSDWFQSTHPQGVRPSASRP